MRGERDMTEDEKRSLIYGGTPSQKSIPVQGGAASRVPTYSDRTDLNDMLNSSPETQFLGTQPTPSPTPTPTPAPAPQSLQTGNAANRFAFFNTPQTATPATFNPPQTINYRQPQIQNAVPQIPEPLSQLEMADLQKKYGFNYG